MQISKLLLATAGAIVFLGTLVSGASARNLSTSNQSISGMWSSLRFGGAFGEATCRLTLEGSMHSRTMQKVNGSLVGYITSAILGSCATGAATILQETLPWHMRYAGFQGTLPNITSFIIQTTGLSIRIRETFGTGCHVLATAAEPGIATTHRNTITHELTEVGITGRIRTGPECLGQEGTFSSDSGPISVSGRSEVRLSISLI